MQLEISASIIIVRHGRIILIPSTTRKQFFDGSMEDHDSAKYLELKDFRPLS